MTMMWLRRRWRLLLWLVLVVVVTLNTVVFMVMPETKSVDNEENKDDYNVGDGASRARSHLQAPRKRLNASNNNTSSNQAAEKIEEAWPLSWKFFRGDTKQADDDQDGSDNDENKISMEPAEKKKINDVLDEAGARDLVNGKKYPVGAVHLEGVNVISQGNKKSAVTGRLGCSANYSDSSVDNLVKLLNKKHFADGKENYMTFLKRMQSKSVKKGPRLKAYFNNKGRHAWERFHHGIHQHFLYDPDETYMQELLSDLRDKKIVDIEQKEGGTQLKLIVTMEDGGQALFKPMRFPREQMTLPDHFYFADYERHVAEIGAFHLDRMLGFHRVPPTAGRVLNVTSEIKRFANNKFSRTFFVSPAGNMCFHGHCSYYCDSSHPICGHPYMIEGSMAAFLPPEKMAKRKTWRNPWKRSYSKHRKAYWEVYTDLCQKVIVKPPYNQGRRLLDVLDMSVFDFLTGNLDRHHYETFDEFGNVTFPLHMDNGRAFGKAYQDDMSCLAPVIQCCKIRRSTLLKLVKLYEGPDSLSQLMRESLSSDRVAPVLIEPHLDALDRRVTKVLRTIHDCLHTGVGISWALNDVVIEDGVT